MRSVQCCFFCVLSFGLLDVLGRASAQPSDEAELADIRTVLLFAPEDVRAAYAAALGIELGPNAHVVAAEPVYGDAELQRSASEHGACAAVLLEHDAHLWIAHVWTRDAAAARRTTIAADADPRTVALILVSLLEDPAPDVLVAQEPAPAPHPLLPVTSRARALDEPNVPERVDASDDAPETAQITARIGTGGFALANDRRFIPGAMLRGGVGLNVGFFEGAFLADAALMLDELPREGGEIQPLARLCFEPGFAFPFDSTFSFHVGARICGGFAELRVVVFIDSFGRTGTFDSLGGLVSGGGYLAFSARLSDTARLYIRGDFEAAWVDASMDEGEMFPVISAILSMF